MKNPTYLSVDRFENLVMITELEDRIILQYIDPFTGDPVLRTFSEIKRATDFAKLFLL